MLLVVQMLRVVQMLLVADVGRRRLHLIHGCYQDRLVLLVMRSTLISACLHLGPNVGMDASF